MKPDFRLALSKSPLLVHSMLISMHLPSWQDYLEYHETVVLNLVSLVLHKGILYDRN